MKSTREHQTARNGPRRAPLPARAQGWSDMETNGSSGRSPRCNASHVVDAELEHLEWATRQPMVHMMNADYWRRRLLAVKLEYELTQQQGAIIERILKRLV
jgi:hypothetical protein